MGLLARRVGAYVLDWSLAAIAMQVISMFDPFAIQLTRFGGPIPVNETETLEMFRVFSPIGWLVLLPLLLSRDVLRVGKLVFGIRVVRTRPGRTMHLGISIVRTLAFFIPFGVLIEYIVARISPKGLRLMDRWLGTQTVPTSGVFPAPDDRRAAPFSAFDLVNLVIPMLACCVTVTGMSALMMIPVVNEVNRPAEVEYDDGYRGAVEAEKPAAEGNEAIPRLRELHDAQQAWHRYHGFYGSSVGDLIGEGYLAQGEFSSALLEQREYRQYFFYNLTPPSSLPSRFAFVLVPSNWSGTAYLIDHLGRIYVADAGVATLTPWPEEQADPPDPWRLY